MKPLLILLLFIYSCTSAPKEKPDPRLQAQASRITIIRDEWGIPHIYGKTDADAVFGAMYAQCEESFERVERAYIEKLGRMAEIEGEAYLLQDVKMRLLYDSATAIADYKRSPVWLKKLLQSFSDGIHYYLQTHPQTKPVLLQRFEPWFPLLATDGAFIATQTGGLQTSDTRQLYQGVLEVKEPPADKPSAGSNGFAVAPSRSASGKALLYINPHVTFYFRTEMQLVSEEGLNVYGAVTWGQFFIFQGFNEHCGWMHTSSAADAADLYQEKIVQTDSGLFYQYNDTLLPVAQNKTGVNYKKGEELFTQPLTIYATHHGVVVGKRNDYWLSLKAMNHSLSGLIQSWQRMKAKNRQAFTQILELRANPSTNTLYADAEGNIAYWQGNFLPKRSDTLNTFAPLDGTVKTTEWQGTHELKDLVQYLNPSSGFLQNCNSSPYSAAGLDVKRKMRYPKYMAPEAENFRSLHALKELSKKKEWTPQSLVALGYDRYLSIFDTLLPPLLKDLAAINNTINNFQLDDVADTLNAWNRTSDIGSVATTVAVFWAYTILSLPHGGMPQALVRDEVGSAGWLMRNTTSQQRLSALNEVLQGLQNLYGTWKKPWGEINRYQRLTGGQRSRFDNDAQSFPSGLASAALGSLASYETAWNKDRQYGIAGNSFVAVVEFGERVKAWSISTGGQACTPTSKNFTDQTQRFLEGQLKEVWFYKEDVEKHATKTYSLSNKKQE